MRHSHSSRLGAVMLARAGAGGAGHGCLPGRERRHRRLRMTRSATWRPLPSWRFDPDTGEVTDYFIRRNGFPAWCVATGNRVASSTIEIREHLGQDARRQRAADHHLTAYETRGGRPRRHQDCVCVYVRRAARSMQFTTGPGFQHLLDAEYPHSTEMVAQTGTRIAFERDGSTGETDSRDLRPDAREWGRAPKITDNTTADDERRTGRPTGPSSTFQRAGSRRSTGSTRTAAARRAALAVPETLRPAWSPDGTRIAFSTGDHIYTMAPDGSDQPVVFDAHRVLRASMPDWQPLPVNTSSTLRAPQGRDALPYFSLVPAAQACTAPNRAARPAAGVRRPAIPPAARLAQPHRRASGTAARRSRGRSALVRLDVDGGAGRAARRHRREHPLQPHERDEGSRPLRVHGRAAGAWLRCALTDREGSVAPTTVGLPDWRSTCPVRRRTARHDARRVAACSSTTTLDARAAPAAAAEGSRADLGARTSCSVYDGGPDGDADTERRQLACSRRRACSFRRRSAGRDQHHAARAPATTPTCAMRCGRSPSTTAARPTVVSG